MMAMQRVRDIQLEDIQIFICLKTRRTDRDAGAVKSLNLSPENAAIEQFDVASFDKIFRRRRSNKLAKVDTVELRPVEFRRERDLLKIEFFFVNVSPASFHIRGSAVKLVESKFCQKRVFFFDFLSRVQAANWDAKSNQEDDKNELIGVVEYASLAGGTNKELWKMWLSIATLFHESGAKKKVLPNLIRDD